MNLSSAAFVAVVSLTLCAQAEATTLFKCKSATGSTYSDKPCAANAEAITVKTHEPDPAVSDNTQEMKDNYQRRLGEIKAGNTEGACLGDAEREILRPSKANEEALRARINKLRLSMLRSNNNNAGAQRDTGIRTEIAGLEQSIATERSSAAIQMSAARQDCADQARRVREQNEPPKD